MTINRWISVFCSFAMGAALSLNGFNCFTWQFYMFITIFIVFGLTARG